MMVEVVILAALVCQPDVRHPDRGPSPGLQACLREQAMERERQRQAAASDERMSR